MGILLDQKYRHAGVAVQVSHDFKNLPHDERRESQRRFIQARLILDRTIPAYKPVSMPIQLNEALPANQHERATELFTLATNGTLTLEEFTTLLSTVIEMKKIEKEDKNEKAFPGFL